MDEKPNRNNRPTPQFKYIPPPLSRKPVVPSVDNNGGFKPVYIPRKQTLSGSLRAYLKENPLVAIGCVGILASFGTGVTLFYRGIHPVWEERMMWSRCCFQAMTAFAIGYSEYKRVKEVQKIYSEYTPEEINQILQKKYGIK